MKNEKREIRYSRNYLHEVNFTDDNGVTGQYIFHNEKDAEKFDRIKSIEVDNFDTPERMLPFDFDKDIIKTVELKIPSDMALHDAIRDYVPPMVENLAIKRTDKRDNREYEYILSGLNQAASVTADNKSIVSTHSLTGDVEDVSLAMHHREFLSALSTGSQRNMNIHPFYVNFPLTTLSDMKYEHEYEPIAGKNDKTVMRYVEAYDSGTYISIDEITRSDKGNGVGDMLTLGIEDVGTDSELFFDLCGNSNVPLKDFIQMKDFTFNSDGKPLFFYASIETDTLNKGIDILMDEKNKRALGNAVVEIKEDNGYGVCYTADIENGSYTVQFGGEDITFSNGFECVSNVYEYSEKLSEAMYNFAFALDETRYEISPADKENIIKSLPDNSFLNKEKENEMDI